MQLLGWTTTQEGDFIRVHIVIFRYKQRKLYILFCLILSTLRAN